MRVQVLLSFVSAASSTGLLLVLPASAVASYKALGVPHIPQQAVDYSGAAVIEMWAEWRDGSDLEQSEIVLHLTPGEKNGGSPEEVKEALEEYASDFYTDGVEFSAESLAMEIIQQVNQDQPVAVRAKLRGTDGNIEQCGHWLLVDGYDLNADVYQAWGHLDGFYLNDPLHGSSLTQYHNAGSPGQFKDKAFFYDTLVSKCTDGWWTGYYIVKN
jgi:hypothetical protein